MIKNGGKSNLKGNYVVKEGWSEDRINKMENWKEMKGEDNGGKWKKI